MSDEELAVYLGIAGHPNTAKAIASITPEKRKLYEAMKQLETDVVLWENGLGPRPNAILDYPKNIRFGREDA